MQGGLKSLQILRAIAATSVVYYHIALPPEANAIPRFGSFGVDIFFVISGFVMAMVVARGQQARTFAISRIARIVPLYWLLTSGVLILALTQPQLLQTTTADLGNYLKSILFIPYFKESGKLQPMLVVGWTLNYEMFFYFCVWLSIVVARRVYLLLTIALLFATYVLLGKHSENAVLEAFFGRLMIFEFAFGLLAYHIYKSGILTRLSSTSLILVSLLSYGFMAVAEAKELDADRMFLYGIPSLALVSVATALEDLKIARAGAVADVLASMGDGSYATYLTHFYVVEGMRRLVFPRLDFIDPYSPLGVLIIITASQAVGQVCYGLLDKPLSDSLRRRLLAISAPPRRVVPSARQ